jgi:hypothetical protein
MADTTKIHVWLDDPAVVVPLRKLADTEARSLKGMIQIAVLEWLKRNAA